MTLKEAICLFEQVINQPYERDILIRWLGELDGMAIREIFCRACPEDDAPGSLIPVPRPRTPRC